MSFIKDIKDKILPKKKYDFEDTLDDNNIIVNRISPDSIEVAEDYVRSGNNYTRTLVATDFKKILDQEKVRKISEISENITVVKYLDVYDDALVQQQLSRSIQQNRSKLQEERLSHGVKARAKVEIENAEMFLEELVSDTKRVFMVQYLIHIVASTKEELERITNRIRTQVGSIGKFIYPMTRSKDAFDSFLPLNKNKVYDLTYRPMNSEATSFLFPFHENEIFDKNGIIQGRNLDTNNIVMVDDEKFLNKHSVYIGTTGSGKSTAMFSNMLRKYMFGNRIIVIDPKRDYGEILKRIGGEWVRFSLSKGSSVINPFDLPEKTFMEHDGVLTVENPLFDKISTLITMFQLMYTDMSDLESDVLSEVLLELYEIFSITEDTDVSVLSNEDFPRMIDLYNLIEDKKEKSPEQYDILKDFHQTLRAYAKGTYSNVFNGHTNVDVNNDLISYDLFSVYNYKRIQKPLYFLLLSSLRNDILNGDKKPTQLYIDEAHIIADPKVAVAMEYLYEMMKVVRSFNCGITAATQSISDFLSATDGNRNYGESVITLSLQQLILPMSDKEIAFVNEQMHYDFSEDDKEYLKFEEVNKDEKAGKGFLFVGSKKVKMQVELTDFESKMWIDKDFSDLEKVN